MGLALVYPVRRVDSSYWVASRSFLFGMRDLILTLSGEDLAQLAEGLSSLGFWPLEVGLAWLVAEGARRYAADQRTWEELAASRAPDRDGVRLELQRREALAHALSMRARTLARERERDILREQVASLSVEYTRLRRALFALRSQQGAPSGPPEKGLGKGQLTPAGEHDVLATVHVSLDAEAAQAVDGVLRTEGWTEPEGLRILLGYGAAVHLWPAPDDALRALGAARAELATLRHRAYLADEAVRGLRMNLVGLEASVEQARRSLAEWGRRPGGLAPAPPDARVPSPPAPRAGKGQRIRSWIGRFLRSVRRAW
ncbi:MAG: hypothetical protein QN202_09315 [Armatimonadota bacterium]|nr:hypothetical protein [Armatimonadota bacterium]